MKEKLKEKSNVGALSVRNTRKNLPNCAQKGNKGITLVALIITIIVLLILAVVAIRGVQGDGIITKAKEAKTKTEQAQADEEQKLLELEYQMAKSQGTFTGTFNDYLLKKEYDNKVADGTFTGTFNDYLLKKEYDNKVADGTFTGTYDEYLSSKYSLGEATNVENYGKKVVGYSSKGAGLSSLIWRIFYQDDKNVYLISQTADGNYPVNGLSFYTYTNNSGTYTFTKKNIVEKYNSGADVSIQGKLLMPKASSLFTTENTNENIIATAYLCDTAVWDEYTDLEGKAEYAIGGPTVELFEKSYNAISVGNKINTTVEGDGYTDGGTSSNWFKTDQKSGIYRLKSSEESWWLASPSVTTLFPGKHILSILDGYGLINEERMIPHEHSARPIVCIPVANFNYTLAD